MLSQKQELDFLRKRNAELEARELNRVQAEWQYSSIFEDSLVGFYQITPEGRFLKLNLCLARMLGYNSPEEVIDQVMDEKNQIFVNTMTRDEILSSHKEHDTLLFHEVELRRKDGSVFWVYSNSHAFRDDSGRVLYYEGSLVEITAKKNLEVSLRETNNYLNNLINYANAPIIVWDAYFKITRFNHAFERLTGLYQQDVLGKHIDILFTQENRDYALGLIEKTLAGEYWEIVEIPIKTTNGDERLVLWNSANVLDEKNQILATIAQGVDITDRKRLETQLQQTQKMEALGILSGGIAHDFNNILAAMIGYAELAKIESDEKMRRQNLSQILRSCERAKGLVTQILSFSRKTDVDKKTIDIRPVIKETIKLLRSAIPTTIDFRQTIPDDPLIAFANPTQIHQIIMNLCTNAAYAMRDNGGILEINLTTVNLSAEDVKLISGITPGIYLKLEVKDTGHGIDEAIKNRIFDPFFTTKGLAEGTGLGLSVVYGIVKGHGGAIVVYSAPGSGSTFIVYLPHITDRELQEVIEEGDNLPTGKERILFVDDEEILTQLGRGMLKKLGYLVLDVTDSVQARDMFMTNPYAYDLLITDMTMPKLNGLDLSRAVLKIRPEMPIILSTGYSDLVDKDKAEKEGISVFITKPYHFRELAHAVRKAIGVVKTP